MEAHLNFSTSISPHAYHMRIYRSSLYIKFKYDLAARIAVFSRFTQPLDPNLFLAKSGSQSGGQPFPHIKYEILLPESWLRLTKGTHCCRMSLCRTMHGCVCV